MLAMIRNIRSRVNTQEKIDICQQYMLTERYRLSLDNTSPSSSDKATLLWDTIAQTGSKLSVESLQKQVQSNVWNQSNKILESVSQVLCTKTTFEKQLSSIKRCATSELAEFNTFQQNACRGILGFSVSPIETASAGAGLCVRGNNATTGSVVAFFPGKVYLPGHLRNPSNVKQLSGNTMARSRVDKIIIDASSDDIVVNNTSNPFALGHLVNHPNKEEEPNVIACPVDFPHDTKHKDIIPNSYISPPGFIDSFGRSKILTYGIVLIASRDLKDSEELLLDYRFNPAHPYPEWYFPVDPEADKALWE